MVVFIEAVEARDPHIIARGMDIVEAWHDLRANLLALGSIGADADHQGGPPSDLSSEEAVD